MGAIIVSGDEIKAARERRGLTQKQLAKLLGVTHSAISHWERGRTDVAAASARSVVRWLNSEGAAEAAPRTPTVESKHGIGKNIHEWRASTQMLEIRVSQKLKDAVAEFGLDLQELFETIGTQAVRETLDEEWKRRNADAIRAWSKELEENGLPLERYRLF
jgi:antitoxin CcdA